MCEQNFGETLLTSRFRPLHAVNILITGGLFLLLGVDGLVTRFVVPAGEGSMLRGALYVVLGIGLVAGFQGLTQLLRPQVLVEATDRGLVLHRQPGSARATPKRFLVPWKRVERLDYEVHALPTGIRKTRMETIAVRVSPDREAPVPKGLSHLLEALPGVDPGSVYLDAGSGRPGGRELLELLEELRRRYG